MFNTDTNTITKTAKRKINLTITPNVYQQFSDKVKRNLQPKSWVIEQLMRNYINSTSHSIFQRKIQITVS